MEKGYCIRTFYFRTKTITLIHFKYDIYEGNIRTLMERNDGPAGRAHGWSVFCTRAGEPINGTCSRDHLDLPPEDIFILGVEEFT